MHQDDMPKKYNCKRELDKYTISNNIRLKRDGSNAIERTGRVVVYGPRSMRTGRPGQTESIFQVEIQGIGKCSQLNKEKFRGSEIIVISDIQSAIKGVLFET